MHQEEQDPLEAIRTVGDRLFDFHVADSNRRPPGQGAVDWPPILRLLDEIGYTGPLTAEVDRRATGAGSPRCLRRTGSSRRLLRRGRNGYPGISSDRAASRDNRTEELMMEIALVEVVWERSRYEGNAGPSRKRRSLDSRRSTSPRSRRPMSGPAPATARGCRGVGLPVRSAICVSLGIGGDYHTSVQRFHVNRAKAHLDLAAGLGARNMLFVIGEYISQNEIISADDQWAIAVETFARSPSTPKRSVSSWPWRWSTGAMRSSTRSPRRFGSWTKSGSTRARRTSISTTSGR